MTKQCLFILLIPLLAAHTSAQLQTGGPSITYSSYLGGSGDDLPYAVATDSTGAIYIAGVTQSVDFPVSNNAFQRMSRGMGDIFVTKINASGAIVFSTYIGGGSEDGDITNRVGGIAVDSFGNAYVTGVTTSSDFPTTPTAFQPTFGTRVACDNGLTIAPCGDAFVFKLNAAGTALIYSSFLGGSQHEEGKAIALDSTGAAYVTGTTTSADFPVTQGAFQRTNPGSDETEDVFVTKISPDGSTLVYSTLLGGSGDDISFSIAIDSTGAAVIGGATNSTNFPLRHGLDCRLDDAWDAFVSKLSPDGTDLQFSTLLGGEGTQEVLAVALDAGSNIYLAGFTSSADFPIVNAFQPDFGNGAGVGFVTKLRADGSAIAYSTFFGGEKAMTALNAITVNGSGEAFVAGIGGVDSPVVNLSQAFGGGSDALVAKLTPDGSAVYWSTFFGGNGDDSATAIALDQQGNVVIAGETGSSNLPTLANSTQPALGGASDAFVARFADRPTNGPILSAPMLVEIGEIYVGMRSTSKVLRISNPGSPTLQITRIATTSNVTAASDCVSVLANQSCTLTVSLAADNLGATSGTVTLYDNAPDSPQIFTVRGSGVYGGDLEVVSLSGGNVYLNSGKPTILMTAVVRNNGPNDSELVTLRISGNTAGTDCNPCGLGTLKAGGTATVRFNRTSDSFGTIPVTATAVASARTPDLNSANDSQTINVAIPPYTATPAEIVFPQQPLNTVSAAQRIVFHSMGFEPFRLFVSLNGDFAQTNTCGQINDDGCYLDVTFKPSAVGSRVGTLSIYETNAGTTQTLPLSGVGVRAPVASFSSTSLDFGAQQINTTSPVRTITLSNTGSDVMQIMSISIYGDFAQTHNCPVTLDVGASCNISIRFAPVGSGQRSGTLLIQDNAGGNPHAILLQGLGGTSATMITPTRPSRSKRETAVSTPASKGTVLAASPNHVVSHPDALPARQQTQQYWIFSETPPGLCTGNQKKGCTHKQGSHTSNSWKAKRRIGVPPKK